MEPLLIVITDQFNRSQSSRTYRGSSSPFDCVARRFLAGIRAFSQDLSSPEHFKASLKRMRAVCMQETGVEEKFIEASVEGYVSDDPEIKCYIDCILRHCEMV